jgi:enoyl-CoA hydratase
VSDEDLVLYERDGGVAVLTLNRPDKLNAFNDDLYDALMSRLDEAEADDDVRVVVIKAAGRAFSTGHDLTQVSSVYEGWTVPKPGEKPRRPSQRTRLMTDRRRMHTRWHRLFNFPKITIAQVHGYCIEGACNMQILCDITVAAEDAVFNYQGQRLAAGGASTLMVHLSHLIGYKRARELILTGRNVSGVEAAQLGLVNHAVPADRLEAETMAMARNIAEIPRDAIVMGKFYTCLAYDMMGLNSAFNAFTIGHTLATNVRFEEDEYNFHKMRRDVGARDASRNVNAHFAQD